MADLFETTSIKSLNLANRFVRSATGTRFARDDGCVTAKLTQHIMDLVDGGVGLIVSGHAYVLPDGQASPRQLGIYSDTLVSGLNELVKAVHTGGGKIVAQISHAGAHSNLTLTGVEPMGPSAIPQTEGKRITYAGCRAMTIADIDRVIEGFRQAACRAYTAGFDGIQLHSAHSYLFSQFLSPFYNKRTDKYGGSVKNRVRIVVDTYKAVRNEVGEDYPIMIKMNVTDFLDDGLSTEEAIEAASVHASVGFDAIELSGGTIWGSRILGDTNRGPCQNVLEEGYYQDQAKQLKHAMQTPIILTGGIRSYDIARQLVQDNITDYIGLCRPLIREPDLVNRWQFGDTAKSGCVSDSACLFRGPDKELQCFHLKAS